MKNKILFVLVLFTSCYRMHEYNYLFINFNESKLSAQAVKTFIDDVKNKNLSVPDSIDYIFLSGNKLNENERIIHFENKPDEWYLVVLNTDPCWIKTIYNKNLADTLIDKPQSLSPEEVVRIKKRFQNEILKPAEIFNKKHNIHDSIIYKNDRYK